ncbi:hypothetical protein L6R52_32215 [Myxococcota bacterium]|nr:hypothetical protein [Myxococcota bacterium]
MVLDPAFVADCPYGPEGLLIDEILEVDPERSYVRATMPTHEELPLTREQRAHELRHPRHVSGGLMVHMTGMLGFAHAYYVLGLRHSDGWIGYGVKIYEARFVTIARPGPKLVLECTAKRVRRADKSAFGRYTFKFTQEDRLVYEGDQSAMWQLVDDAGDRAPAL